MHNSNTIPLPEVVPVMSLSETTLFPQAVVPLYIFEERYRSMLEDALSTHRMICIADIENEYDDFTDANKKDKKISGIGMVRACKTNPDGTSHLILQGLARIQIHQLILEKAYPQAVITEAKSSNKHSSINTLNIKTNLLDAIECLIQLNQQLPEDILPFLASVSDEESLLDIAIASICPSGKFKQSLLETLDIEKRYHAFSSFLKKEKQQILINKKLLGDLDENDTKNN